MAANERTDLGTGLATLLALIAVGGALLTYLYPGGAIAGGGFAVAVGAAVVAVVALHAYSSR